MGGGTQIQALYTCMTKHTFVEIFPIMKNTPKQEFYLVSHVILFLHKTFWDKFCQMGEFEKYPLNVPNRILKKNPVS